MKFGDVAYVPGTGPDGSRCSGCAFFERISARNGRCEKAAELRRISIYKIKPIADATKGCKYYEKYI